ncbi:hypothetical protein BDAP_000546 [Binucleata daphniae]
MNPNPIIYNEIAAKNVELVFHDNKLKDVNKETVYQLIRNIVDPEHPQTIEQLGIVTLDSVKVYKKETDDLFLSNGLEVTVVEVTYKPTIPHCSMAAVIGLGIKIQLMKYLDIKYHTKVLIAENSHVQECELNKQINDKDRVMAATENEGVIDFLEPLLPILQTD